MLRGTLPTEGLSDLSVRQLRESSLRSRVRQKEQKIGRACIVIEVQLLVTLPTYFVYRVRRPYQLGTGLGTDTSPRLRPVRPTGYEHQNKASAELSLIKSLVDRTKYLRVILPLSTEGLSI